VVFVSYARRDNLGAEYLKRFYIDLCHEVSQAAGLQAARELADQGRLDQAADLYGNVVKLDPGNAQGHLELGKLFLRKGNGDAARENLSVAVELGGDPSTTREATILLKQTLGAPGEPRASLDRRAQAG
jgi:lipopolysaccharide biosynthesis regulator YciM